MGGHKLTKYFFSKNMILHVNFSIILLLNITTYEVEVGIFNCHNFFWRWGGVTDVVIRKQPLIIYASINDCPARLL